MAKLTNTYLITVNAQAISSSDDRLCILGCRTVVVSQFDFRGLPLTEYSEHISISRFIRKYGCLPTAGMIGCATAHRYCYSHMLAAAAEVSLIMEDDFLVPSNTGEILKELVPLIGPNTLLNLRMTNGTWRARPQYKTRVGSIFRASAWQAGAHGYLIGNNLARRFVLTQSPLLTSLADWPLETFRFDCLGLEGEAFRLSGRETTVQNQTSLVGTAAGARYDHAVHRARHLGFRALSKVFSYRGDVSR